MEFLKNHISLMDQQFLNLEDTLLMQNEKKEYKLIDHYDVNSVGQHLTLRGLVPAKPPSDNLLELVNGVEMISLEGSSTQLGNLIRLAQSIRYFIECHAPSMEPPYVEILNQVHCLIRKTLRYKFLAINKKSIIYQLILKDCLEDVVLFDTGYYRHNVCIVIANGKTLYRCNKGGCSVGDEVIEEFRITKPEVLTVDVIRKLMEDYNREENKSFIHKELPHLLGLEFVKVYTGTKQKGGHCDWMSKKKAVYILLHHFSLNMQRNKTMIEMNVCENNTLYANNMRLIYKTFTHFDRYDGLDTFFERYSLAHFTPLVLRRIICTHHNPNKERHLTLGRKAVQFLKTLPDFQDIFLECLIKHWEIGQEHDVKKQSEFTEFLRKIGLDITRTYENFPIHIRFFNAVVQGNDKEVQEILIEIKEKQIQLMTLRYVGWTPLHIAAGNDHLAIIKQLINFDVTMRYSKNSLQKTLFIMRVQLRPQKW